MWRRIRAMAHKEYLHIIRDFRTLYLALIMPVVMIMLFGYAINFDIDHIGMGICDQDNSKSSREFINKIKAGDWFSVKLVTHETSQVEKAMMDGTIKIGIFIPPHFERSLVRGETAPLSAIVDGSDNNAANTGINYLDIFLQQYQRGLMEGFFNRYGIPLPPQVRVMPKILFNPELLSRYYILPGIIVLIMAIIAALLTSLTMAREWERGTMEQLISTPVRPLEIILGKLIPYIGISLLQVLISVVFAVFIFHVPFVGNLISLFLTSTLFAVGVLGLGIALSSVLKSQLPAMQVALIVTMLPSILLSNFVFPIDSMPPIIRMITYIVPAKYFLVMLRTIFLKGTGMMAYTTEIMFLVLFCIFIIAVATKKTQKRIV